VAAQENLAAQENSAKNFAKKFGRDVGQGIRPGKFAMFGQAISSSR
jgi:hypothetical protein